MKTQTFQLSDSLTTQASGTLTSLLQRIPGVSAVACAPDSDRVSVDFDEDRTSGLEIQTVIARAGCVPAPHAQGRTTCCGGCGGGH